MPPLIIPHRTCRYGGTSDSNTTAPAAAVTAFYSAVDTKDFGQLATAVQDTSTFTATFGRASR